nr:hypothetical protein [Tanacetum cinerariifolium]
MSYLSDFEELNGGYVAFGGNPKDGKITGKGKFKTGKLDFDDVYFVKELKFNLFSVSQMCDKKNSVLFTDTECLVLSSDFKLPDASQVLLRVPRENNMYNINLRNIVPSGDLICLFAKATLDESNLWHRRLGHVNFKTINKLIKLNLVRGLPTKDETTPVLKTFIIGLENLLSLKVKVIKCNNRTEFKNSDLNQFCGLKGIKREFSVPRTLQQNGIAERKNRTLIEAARTFKAFRVFNSRTHIVQETLHVNFMKHKPNVASSGPAWLFDIDSRTRTMNYHPVLAENQTNSHACFQDTKKAGDEGTYTYVLFPMLSDGFTNSQNNNKDALVDGKEHDDDIQKSMSPDIHSSSSHAQTRKQGDKTENKDKGKSPVVTITRFKDLNAEFEECTNNNSNGVNAASSSVSTTGHNFINNTNDFSAAGIVIRNKARLVTQGHTQEEGIDYKEALKDKEVIDSGCSRYMTGNMSYLSDFEVLNGGYVAFGGNFKGGKITGKGKIKTGKLDFDDVYFVKELKFNLFSVSQMVPKENNMYNVNLKNIIPSGNLTCLFEKATLDESNLWHRRLGHVNFKTINELVKGTLVRGLPSKVFTNDNSCVACKKGKQHRASCKPRLFSWVFFLASKDETAPVLKTFIIGLENLLSLKVKCPKDPQQNGIAERKNMTLIEAARTLLANSLLLIPFWAEAVNTACYVQNRVLVTKPHNKTPYELLHGRLPSIGFMRPFGCPVTILNTLNPLDKFQGKVDEGFLVGYSVCSSGPAWLFDIDSLTQTMNYHPVIAENQTNSHAVNAASSLVSAAGQNYINNTNDFSAAGPSNTASSPTAANTSDMPNLEDITHSNDTDDVGAEADINNIESIILVSPIPTTRIHKDHPTSQIIDDIIFGATNKALCQSFKKLMKDKFQMSSMGELTFFLGLQQKKDGIFISQEKYVDEILKKFELFEGKSVSTPIDADKPLLKDSDGEDVDAYTYRSMIGSLMYLSSSRPDIMFAFWNTVSVKHSDDVTRLQALVNRKKIVISEDVIREILQLDDGEGVVCLPNEEIFAGLAQMGYEKPSTKLTFYKAFFSRVETPLFEGMLAARQLVEEGITEEQVQADVAVAAAVQENVAEDDANDAIPSPPFHDIPSPSQEQSSPPQQPQNTCSALTRHVENLEHDNAAQKLEIIKLQARVKRLERVNKVKSSKLRRLRKVGASKRIESSDDMEDVFNQGRMIDELDKDEGIELVVNQIKDADIAETEGRHAAKQAKKQVEIYHLDLDHPSKVLNVVTAASQVSVVSAASATISAAKPSIPAAAPTVVAACIRRRKGVIIKDPEEELSSKTLAETPKLKDKGKEEESEMSLELLRFTRQQLQEYQQG